MEKSKNNPRQISEIILIIVIILSIGLVVMEMTSNLSAEIASQSEKVTTVEEIEMESTPIPTLTAEEIREGLSAPVGEEGN